jgi:hypothetical protein
LRRNTLGKGRLLSVHAHRRKGLLGLGLGSRYESAIHRRRAAGLLKMGCAAISRRPRRGRLLSERLSAAHPLLLLLLLRNRSPGSKTTRAWRRRID